MDELQVGSDICEEAGLAEEAKFLRSVSTASGVAYLVVEYGFEYNDEIYDLNEQASPNQVFLDKATAFRAAELKNARHLRQYNPFAFCFEVDEISSLKSNEVKSRIAEIIGDPNFQIDDSGELDSVFPSDATDDQLREIMRLFDKLEFFHVVETKVSV